MVTTKGHGVCVIRGDEMNVIVKKETHQKKKERTGVMKSVAEARNCASFHLMMHFLDRRRRRDIEGLVGYANNSGATKDLIGRTHTQIDHSFD